MVQETDPCDIEAVGQDSYELADNAVGDADKHSDDRTAGAAAVVAVAVVDVADDID